MQPLRLLIVATAMVAVLALVAGFAAENDRVERGRTTTQETLRQLPSSNRVIEAKVPSKEPIEVREGETIRLTITLEAEDTVTIDAIGFDETVAAGIPTEVLFTATVPGRFPFRLQNSGKDIGELVVKRARAVSEQPDETPNVPATPAPAGTASA